MHLHTFSWIIHTSADITFFPTRWLLFSHPREKNLLKPGINFEQLPVGHVLDTLTTELPARSFYGVAMCQAEVKFLIGLYSINTRFNTSTTDCFENIVAKGEIARDEQFLLFPQYFLLKWIIVSPFVHILAIISLFAAELEERKICISGNGLTS